MIKKFPKIICVTGGKGGTGKTLCAVNIATMFKNEGYKVLLVDGDVENPNTYLLLGADLENPEEVFFFVPKILQEKCSKCGLCAQNCIGHALLHITDSYPIPMLDICSGCQLCYKICPEKAIEAGSKLIGTIYSTEKSGLSLLVGELKPSEARSARVVEALLEKMDKIIEASSSKFDVVILDTAPGAHCDVEILIDKADAVIPVTEPTKFGKLDLLRIIELINLIGKECRVIVNRSSLLGFKDQFLEELKKESIEILGDIPLDNDIVYSYCQGIPIMEENSEFKDSVGYKAFQRIFTKIMEWVPIDN